MSFEVKYIPLTFITSQEEILSQLKNSVLFAYLGQRFKETTLEHYIESTQYGFTASASDNGTHRLLRITDITNGKVDWNTVPYCNCDSEQKYLLEKSDILVARTGGTTGKSFIVKDAPDNAVFASYLIRLRLKKEVDLSFIEAFLNSYAFWPQVIEMKSGTAMPNVNAEKLKTLRLPLCDRATQKRFIEALTTKDYAHEYPELTMSLTTVENLFDHSKQLSSELIHQLSLVKQLRQAFLREAMQGKLVPQDPNDEPASELLKKIKAEKEQLIKEKKIKKEKELPPIKPEEIPFEIPKSWVWCRLGAISQSANNGLYKPEKFYKPEGIISLRMFNIQDGKIVLNKARRLILTEPELDTYYLEKNDILVNRVNGIDLVGKAAIIEDVGEPLVYESMNIRLRLIFKNKTAQFINWVLLDKRAREYFYNSAKVANGQVSINQTHLGQFLIPLPPLSEQHRIAIKLEQLMRYCDELEQSIKQSQTQNKQLLQQVLREALQPKKKYEMSNNVSLAK